MQVNWLQCLENLFIVIVFVIEAKINNFSNPGYQYIISTAVGLHFVKFP